MLYGMLGLAARSNAVRGNPVRDLGPISRRSTRAAAVIPRDQLPVPLKRVQEDEHLQAADMVNVIEFLAATGCRVGEVCGPQWDAVDLDADPATIRANAVRAGQGVVVQDHQHLRVRGWPCRRSRGQRQRQRT